MSNKPIPEMTNEELVQELIDECKFDAVYNRYLPEPEPYQEEILKRMKPETNTLIVIGFLGVKTAYLNLSEEEAIRKYCEQEEITLEEFEATYRETMSKTTFTDNFSCYDA